LQQDGSMQVFEWLALALQGTDVNNPVSERQADEIFALVLSALTQSALMVIACVHIIDHSEAIAKQLDALAPNRAPASPTGAL
jgi:hypothetical protein